MSLTCRRCGKPARRTSNYCAECAEVVLAPAKYGDGSLSDFLQVAIVYSLIVALVIVVVLLI
jgi:hypothetical protein